jgi:hypothetical protein
MIWVEWSKAHCRHDGGNGSVVGREDVETLRCLERVEKTGLDDETGERGEEGVGDC